MIQKLYVGMERRTIDVLASILERVLEGEGFSINDTYPIGLGKEQTVYTHSEVLKIEEAIRALKRAGPCDTDEGED